MASVLAQMGGEASPLRKSAIVCLPLAYPESERRQGKQGIPANDVQLSEFLRNFWSWRRDSNPRPQPWQQRGQRPGYAANLGMAASIKRKNRVLRARATDWVFAVEPGVDARRCAGGFGCGGGI